SFSLCVLLLRCLRSSFFFSRRRRHTRSKRDWSSDVCSSDLINARVECSFSYSLASGNKCDAETYIKTPETNPSASPKMSLLRFRSEERRVGKEGKILGSPEE